MNEWVKLFIAFILGVFLSASVKGIASKVKGGA